MTTEAPRRTRGSCLCGSCTFELIGEPIISASCDCNSCVKTSGSNNMWILMYDKDRVDVLASSALASYTDHSGPREVYREFCSVCGSPMFRKMQGWSAVLVAGGTVAESKRENGKGKAAMPAEWVPQQEIACSGNRENLLDIFETYGKQNGASRRK